MRTALATFLVLFAGASLLWHSTDQARAFTSEGARRLSISESPRSVPAVVLQDQTGDRFSFDRFHGKLVVLDFIYTTCADLCIVAGNTLHAIREALPSERLGKEVVLLSVSFDPLRDTVTQLAYYARRYTARADHWPVARVEGNEQLAVLLKTFGVTVIPDRWGGYQHNSAIYVMDRQGQLAAIFDYDDPAAVLRYLEEPA